MTRLLFPLAILGGCATTCPDGSEPSSWFADLDGDGHGDPDQVREACERPWAFVASPDDCDDNDADRRPGRIDDCNDIDDDCDGDIDEDGVDEQRFLDVDGDGYGTAVSWTGCGAPPNTLYRARESGDCDDYDIETHPRASELCNGRDDDCDGDVDEDAIDRTRLFRDDDGDGFGSASTMGCPDDDGHTALGGDCDDGNRSVHPGAPELCNDRDDDCDGFADEEPSEGGMYYLDLDGDGWGGYGTVRACAAGEAYVRLEPYYDYASYYDRYGTYFYAGTYDGGDVPYGAYLVLAPVVASTGDCQDLNPSVHPNASEACDGTDNDCDTLVDDDDPSLAQGLANRYYADVDRDGYGRADLVTFACVRPPFYSLVAGDCDDTDDTVYPFSPEECDGIDNDCNGLIDASDPQLVICP